MNCVGAGTEGAQVSLPQFRPDELSLHRLHRVLSVGQLVLFREMGIELLLETVIVLLQKSVPPLDFLARLQTLVELHPLLAVTGK